MLYSLVFGEGVVNDATSIVLFNAIQNFDLGHIDAVIVLEFVGNFFKLFVTSTLLGAVVSRIMLDLSCALLFLIYTHISWNKILCRVLFYTGRAA